MFKIDNETVRKILDAADIVEVVSDFVSLKRRGANFIGLCPFHNERTPSFSVSKSKGICKCFSCGKGGSPVNFIMLHEQMTYQEALRYLAKKYNIEIKEHEMTEKEREEATERESLLAVNDFALLHFEHNLLDTEEGRNVGLAYFRERGINDAMVKKFRLGYAIDRRDDLLTSARSKGYKDKYLIETGLVGKSERGDLYDRFRGRVMYPVFTISGKVIAFGGRTLRTDKVGGKYVNSPESSIYRKSYELYGLYQAKPAIVKKDKCILVEGYMDVISMFQNGVENVVASSGTSLTEGQIRIIHRFTDNITVIYDSDPAGIKASLRGIDMLLAEGLNVTVLQFPEGEDPDSFAQTHSSEELERYLMENEVDFIKFKTGILLKGVENDPIKRSQVVTDIVRSISVIPNPIPRNIYIKECSYALNVDERVLSAEVAKHIDRLREQEFKKKKLEQEKRNEDAGSGNQPSADPLVELSDGTSDQSPEPVTEPSGVDMSFFMVKDRSQKLEPFERQIIRYLLKYGMLPIDPGELPADGAPYRVVDFISDEMDSDGLTFTNPDFAHLYQLVLSLCDSWEQDFPSAFERFNQMWSDEMAQGEAEIRETAKNTSEITARSQQLKSLCDTRLAERKEEYTMNYVERILSSSPDDIARNLTIDLVADRYVLSKIHTKYSKIEEEKDILVKLVPRAIYELRNAILQLKVQEVADEIKRVYESQPDNLDLILDLLQKQNKMKNLLSEFAKLMGDRVVMPGFKR